MTTMVDAFGVELVQEGQDATGPWRVEVAGGFVGEHDGRLTDQGPGNGHPLALAS